MAITVVLLYGFIVLIDPYGLLKQGLKKDFYVSSSLCLVSFCIAFALAMEWKIPSPSPFIVALIKQFY